MTSVFVDSDVCLDLLVSRKPFNAAAEQLFSLSDHKKIKVNISALSFANLDYILRGTYKVSETRKVLFRFKQFVTVLPVSDKIIELALASDFTDFEDAIQHYTAIEGKIQILITRNIRDYKKASIEVMTPESFLARL